MSKVTFWLEIARRKSLWIYGVRVTNIWHLQYIMLVRTTSSARFTWLQLSIEKRSTSKPNFALVSLFHHESSGFVTEGTVLELWTSRFSCLFLFFFIEITSLYFHSTICRGEELRLWLKHVPNKMSLALHGIALRPLVIMEWLASLYHCVRSVIFIGFMY